MTAFNWMHEINKEGFITSKSIYFKKQSKINVSFGKLSRILNDCNILTMLCFSSQNNIFVSLCIPIILQRTKQRSILILECLLWAPYCPTPGWPKGERRTRQLIEKKDRHGWGLRRRWRIEGMSCEALRDPYALMAQASDTNCCIWLRSRLNWVSLL